MSEEVFQCVYLLANLNGEFFAPVLEVQMVDEFMFLNKEELKAKLAA
jgi:hypothetical protein